MEENRHEKSEDLFLKKFLDKTQNITPEEWNRISQSEEIEEVQEQISNLYDLLDFQPDKNKIYTNIKSEIEIGEPLLYRKISWISSSIAAILILLFGVWILMPREKSFDLSVHQDIQPGKSKAILILPTGERIEINKPEKNMTIYQDEKMEVLIDSTGLISYVNNEKNEMEYNTIIVPRGGEFRLTLSDGTRVWLNSESELTFPLTFSDSIRKVVLKGEGYFDVAHDTQKPFQVSVYDMIVNVLGTRFNINAYQDKGFISTTLLSGKVEIQKEDGKSLCVLSPNQQADYTNNQIHIHTVDANKTISWIDGRFYFDRITLEEIMLQLVRWYDFEYKFQYEELKDYEFAGFFRRDYKAEEIFEIITKTTKIKFIVNQKGVIIDYKD